jgi:hypothetical protein
VTGMYSNQLNYQTSIFQYFKNIEAIASLLLCPVQLNPSRASRDDRHVF